MTLMVVTPLSFVQKHFHKLKRRVSGNAQNAKHMTNPKWVADKQTPILIQRKKQGNIFRTSNILVCDFIMVTIIVIFIKLNVCKQMDFIVMILIDTHPF